MNEALALLGGPKFITQELKKYQPLGSEEIAAAVEVLERGVLSQFVGTWGPDFFGGPKVKEFEHACANFFQVKHAITVNSWTSGLVAAVGAIGVGPGDEVIVPSWTMTASASAVLHWSGIPVFADINADSYCIDLESIKKLRGPKTVAIMTVDIFGQSADILPILEYARQEGLKVICDTAQAPGAKVGSKFAGTLGDIGGISLNYHKHIHTGEGGVLFTDDDELADRMRLIRNHAEAVVESKGATRIDNMVGHNFRLGEVECAIGIQQLKKLPSLTAGRQKVAERLRRGLSGLPGLGLPSISEGNTHVYYVFGLTLQEDVLKVGRSKICDALEAEGVMGLGRGYQNIHLLPVYQRKIAFGKDGFPWTLQPEDRRVDYNKGICPISEELHELSFIGLATCVFDYSEEDVDLVVGAFKKVWSNLETLDKWRPKET